jgi:hypothetical protein
LSRFLLGVILVGDLLLLELAHLAAGRLITLRRPLGQSLDMELPVSVDRTLASGARLDRQPAVHA